MIHEPGIHCRHCLCDLRRHHARLELLSRPESANGRGLLRGRRQRALVRQRHRLRRRLSVGRVVPRHLRHDRVLWLRRLSLFDRLPGRLDRRAVRDRRAAQAAWASTRSPMRSTASSIRAASSWSPAISTLAVSVFYLIPQMVGAGVLIKPLLGLPHWAGVVHGRRGRDPDRRHRRHGLDDLCAVPQGLAAGALQRGADGADPAAWLEGRPEPGSECSRRRSRSRPTARSSSTACRKATAKARPTLRPVGHVSKLPGRRQPKRARSGRSSFCRPSAKARSCSGRRRRRPTTDGNTTTTYSPKPTPGADVLAARQSARRLQAFAERLAAGQAEFPVADAGAVLRHGVAAAHPDSLLHGEGRGRGAQEHGRRHRGIGCFYVLTLLHGPGRDDRRRDRRDRIATWPRRCLARSFGELLFAMISAIAFTTVLGTVSGLIVAASGAVVHDVLTGCLKLEHDRSAKSAHRPRSRPSVVGVVADLCSASCSSR